MSRRRVFIRFSAACLLSVFICVLLGCEDSNNANRPATSAAEQADTQAEHFQNITIVLNESDNGSAKRIALGDTLQIELRGNPTSGYQWELGSYDASVLQQVGAREYKQDAQPVPEHPLVGLGGTFTFRFKGTGTGQTLLKLIYHRSWESQPPHDVFEITVTVQ